MGKILRRAAIILIVLCFGIWVLIFAFWESEPDPTLWARVFARDSVRQNLLHPDSAEFGAESVSEGLANEWMVSGRVKATTTAGQTGELPYKALMVAVCDELDTHSCWRVEVLSIGDENIITR